ncbi:hypothetical protein NW768_006859 [Fusarium equiseti]|uniref:HNH nuclease domain-containing protein n=1 Tax=Fusarium equiseti TaxID=61235 RepID=A0ABQ8R9J7_FUSEQ|nr:hypothetical protein NW768_006859 [Fusarium equiseti]
MNLPGENMDLEAETPFALPLHLRTSAASSDYVTLRPSIENQIRKGCAEDLEKYVQKPLEGFSLRCEHVAAILLAPMDQLKKKGGRLWADMLHLDPKNLVLPVWSHAVPVPLEPQPSPEDVPWDNGVEAYEKAVAYQARFKTKSDLQSVPLDKQRMEEAECRKRDENKCVVTGRLNPRIFWIIPSTWNNTVENMNATGNLHSGCLALTGIDLLDGPNPPCSALELGTTHKSWNMLCIDPVLYNYLIDGWCAFKYLFHEEDINNSNNVKVTLEFHWMPKLEALFGEPVVINEIWTLFSQQMGRFGNCPPPSDLEHGKVRDKSGELLKSGYRFDVLVPKQHVAGFQLGIEVLWTCARFTALCGAAGRPWLLPGMDPEDESMRERQRKAMSRDNQKPVLGSKRLGKFRDSSKQVTDTIRIKGTRKSLSGLFSAAGTSTAASDSTAQRTTAGSEY